MITVPELLELKRMCARIPGALTLLDKVDATPMNCHTCGHKRPGDHYCRQWEAEIPVTEMKNGCDEWWFDEIPF